MKGIVIDRENGEPLDGAELKVKGRDPVFKSTEQGEYWRILMPGYYTIIVGYIIIHFPVHSRGWMS